MAVLKDLIVHGGSRFLGDVYFNFLKAKDIAADTAYFKKLTAVEGTIDDLTSTNLTTKNATVTALLDVQGDMHTNSWSNASIATIDGSFYINPTSSSADSSDVSASNYTPTGSITYNNGNYTEFTVTGTFNTSQLSLNDATSVAWPANSYVIITGDVRVGNEWYPLGTIRGKLYSQLAANTDSKTITIVPIGAQVITGEVGNTSLTDGHGLKPQTLEAIRLASNGSMSGLKMRKIKVSMTSYGGTTQKPIGIFMTAMGSNKKTFLDIYGGVNDTASAVGGGLAKPTVRIGNLEGMPTISNVMPHGWGIYTNNGFFTGTVVAERGKIGNWNIGTDTNKSLYTNTFNADGGVYVSPSYSGVLSIAGSSSKNWAFAAGKNFGVTTDGTLYANNAEVSGRIVVSGNNSNVYTKTETDNAIVGETSKYITAIGNDGIKVHPYNSSTGQADTNDYAKIDSSGMTVYNDGVQRAQFGEVTTIGKPYVSGATDNTSRIVIDYHSLSLLTRDESRYFEVKDLRNENGIATLTISELFEASTSVTKPSISIPYSITSDPVSVLLRPDSASTTTYVEPSDKFTVTRNLSSAMVVFSENFTERTFVAVTFKTTSRYALSFTFGDRFYGKGIGALSSSFGYLLEASGAYSHAEGNGAQASGKASHAEGVSTVASGHVSHAEGNGATASGSMSHAEGNSTEASGPVSHAEGSGTTASNSDSHAEGYQTTASGMYSHAEGEETKALGISSHAEGCETTADRAYSHAQNLGTFANASAQTAIGKYNIRDVESQKAFIIGNGTANDARSNAFTVDWNGNVDIASGAKYKINGTELSASDVGAAAVQKLTQAEYDALTTISDDTIYFITDGSASTRNPYLDMNYPIGSYYETSDANFNPNTVWGGTWVREEGNIAEIKKLLWTNTASSFAAQTVSLALSTYESIEVYFDKGSTSDAWLPNPVQVKIGEYRLVVVIHAVNTTGTNENIGARVVTANTNSVVFGDYSYKNRRTGGTQTVANQFCVPRSIYGVNQVSINKWHRTA